MLTSLSTVCSILVEREVLQTSDLVQVILDVLDDTRSSVLDQVGDRVLHVQGQVLACNNVIGSGEKVSF